jgi:histidine ammonia-lyase
MTSLAVISQRRLAALLDPSRSGGLPAFLRHPQAAPGVDSGLMMAEYTAAALVVELRTRSAPAAVHSIPVCAGTEDHASMSALAARQAIFAVETAQTVVAIELYAACQAVDVAPLPLPPALAALHAAVRAHCPPRVDDRLLADDLEAVRRLVAAGVLC